MTQVTERSREAWQWRGVEQLLADWKLAMRRLGKSPGFAMTVLLTLAIGIGANTAVFSVVNSVLLKPLPYPEADGWWRCGWMRRGRRGWRASQRPAAFAVDVSDVSQSTTGRFNRWACGRRRRRT